MKVNDLIKSYKFIALGLCLALMSVAPAFGHQATPECEQWLAEPNSSPRFAEREMLAHYWAIDKVLNIRYYEPSELSEFELVVQDGRLFYAHKRDEDGQLQPFVARKGIWIMDGRGRFFGLPVSGIFTRFRHSSLKRTAASAGEVKTDATGRVLKFDRNSGHFHPTVESFDQALDLLKSLGLDFSGAKISYMINH